MTSAIKVCPTDVIIKDQRTNLFLLGTKLFNLEIVRDLVGGLLKKEKEGGENVIIKTFSFIWIRRKVGKKENSRRGIRIKIVSAQGRRKLLAM